MSEVITHIWSRLSGTIDIHISIFNYCTQIACFNHNFQVLRLSVVSPAISLYGVICARNEHAPWHWNWFHWWGEMLCYWFSPFIFIAYGRIVLRLFHSSYATLWIGTPIRCRLLCMCNRMESCCIWSASSIKSFSSSHSILNWKTGSTTEHTWQCWLEFWHKSWTLRITDISIFSDFPKWRRSSPMSSSFQCRPKNSVSSVQYRIPS